jgi:drug/metabolite transporter superfamily protein YnfA
MSPRATNLVLFVAVPSLVLTGLVSWALPEDTAGVVLAAHRALGAALIVALAWKWGIARRSIRRRVAAGRSATMIVGGVTSALLLLTLGLGLVWTLGIISFDRPLPYSLLNVHVFAGIALVPLLIAHAAQRSASAITRLPLGRRDALRAAAVVAGGVVLAASLDCVDVSRRATGSRTSSAYPATIWAFDQVPLTSDRPIELITTERRAFMATQLLALPPTEVVATLDCTSGWASTRRWSGVRLASLTDSVDRRVRVTSVTGHSATFSPDEVKTLLLATHVDGDVLTPEHGAPVRLVAPLHRGFMWVKWVTRIEVF